MEKHITAPIISEDQFMDSGDTGEAEGMQRITAKKLAQMTLMKLRGKPNLPKWKGPLGISFRTQIRRQSKGKPYDTLIEITAALIIACQ